MIVKWFSRRFWMPMMVFLAALGLGIGSVPAKEAKKPAGGTNRATLDFRKPIEQLHPLARYGPGADSAIKTDEGLRITLPEGRAKSDEVVGVQLPLRISGNFTIEVGYELLAIGAPTPPLGAGLQLRVEFVTPSPRKAALTRLRKPAGNSKAALFERVGAVGETFGASRINEGPDGQEDWKTSSSSMFRAAESRGKLKLVRTGSQMQYWVVDGNSEYHQIQNYKVGTADVQEIRLFAFSGFRPILVDGRFTDLVIESDGAPALGQAAVPPAVAPTVDATLTPDEVPGPKGRFFLVVGLVSATGVVLAAVLLFCLWRQRRGAPAPAKDRQSRPAAISFACAACGKNLKASSSLAGLKVKCTECGEPALVPGTRASEAGRASP